MAEESEECPVFQINHKLDKNTSESLSIEFDEDHWHTSTKDAYTVQQSKKVQTVGQRRNLVIAEIKEQVLEKLKACEEIADTGINPSEYSDKYCDPNFVPFLDKLEVDGTNLTKYPLYTNNNYTIYKAILGRGGMKARSEIWDMNEPFRKSCTFTTPPELALREPPGGF